LITRLVHCTVDYRDRDRALQILRRKMRVTFGHAGRLMAQDRSYRQQTYPAHRQERRRWMSQVMKSEIPDPRLSTSGVESVSDFLQRLLRRIAK